VNQIWTFPSIFIEFNSEYLRSVCKWSHCLPPPPKKNQTKIQLKLIPKGNLHWRSKRSSLLHFKNKERAVDMNGAACNMNQQNALFDVCWTVRHCDNWRIKNQLDATYYFIVLPMGSTCFGHYYAHHQELATIMFIATLVVSFCKDGRGSVNVKLCFLVGYVRCEVLCHLVVAGNVFLLTLTVWCRNYFFF